MSYHIPFVICEVPKCDEKAEEQILLRSKSMNRFYQQDETIWVCSHHKKEFESGKMFPAFQRLKNAEYKKNNIFTRKTIY